LGGYVYNADWGVDDFSGGDITTSAPYVDNFTRADSTSSLNSIYWEKLVTANPSMGISTNRAYGSTLAGIGYPYMVYGYALENNQYAQFTIGSGTTFLQNNNGRVGVMVRCGLAGSGDGYILWILDTSTNLTTQIITVSGGFGSSTIANTTSISYTVGDIVRFEVSGSGASTNFVVKKNGSTVLTATDSAGSYSSGRAGMALTYQASVGTNLFIDDFTAGDLAVTTGPLQSTRDYGVRSYTRTLVNF
jgi:hypothetical protein